MIPIPQYPLYSASLAEYNMEQVRLFPNVNRFFRLSTKLTQ